MVLKRSYYLIIYIMMIIMILPNYDKIFLLIYLYVVHSPKCGYSVKRISEPSDEEARER